MYTAFHFICFRGRDQNLLMSTACFVTELQFCPCIMTATQWIGTSHCACRSEKEKVKFQQEVYELLAQVESVTKEKVSLPILIAQDYFLIVTQICSKIIADKKQVWLSKSCNLFTYMVIIINLDSKVAADNFSTPKTYL